MNNTQVNLVSFFDGKDLDIRKSHNGRWIDQKCTPDNISIICDCILHFSNDNSQKNPLVFTSRDIWKSDYAFQTITNLYKKPSLNEATAKHEYDKFFQQPMKLLSYAGVLSEAKDKNENCFQIKNYQMLYYLSIREQNSLEFLIKYIEKVLKDSNLFSYFLDFLVHPSNGTYSDCKDIFTRFTKGYTKINNDRECWRIFTKVINPLAYSKNTFGSERGRMSSDIISYYSLMYNRTNFRDDGSNKPKNLTRAQLAQKSIGIKGSAYYDYVSKKAKEYVNYYNSKNNSGFSEVNNIRPMAQQNISSRATQMHHIFPQSQFPEICGDPENIIALTPDEHNNLAHNNMHTQTINPFFQEKCLLSKLKTIKDCITENLDPLYSFDDLLRVLSVGFKDKTILSIQRNNFSQVHDLIINHYKNICPGSISI